MPMYRAGFAHPLSLMHQRSKLLAETIYFVCSVRVGSLRAYTNRQSTPRAQFVCPCSLFSVDRLVLQSFTQFVCDISKGSSRPSAIIDDSNALAPVSRIEQNAPFNVTARESEDGHLILAVRCVRLGFAPRKVSVLLQSFDNCTPSGGQTSRGVVCMLDSLADLVAFHNRRADCVRIVVHTSEDDGTSRSGSEFAFVPILAYYVAVLVFVSGFR